MENIRYGRLDATDEEVISAAKAAHVDSLSVKPDGYNMILNRSYKCIPRAKTAYYNCKGNSFRPENSYFR